MQTAVTKRGQTVIPAAIRKRYQIQEGDTLVWIDDGNTIRVIPIARDPIQALRGSGRGEGLVARLLAERKEDREHEQCGCPSPPFHIIMGLGQKTFT